MQTAYSMSDSN